MKSDTKLFFITVLMSIFALTAIAAVLALILLMPSYAKGSINVKIKAHVKEGKYPLMVVFENNRILLDCDAFYLQGEDIRISLNNVCRLFEALRIEYNDESQIEGLASRLELILDKNRFYPVLVVRPSGIKTFQIFSESNYDKSRLSVPVPEGCPLKLDIESRK